MVKRNTKLIKLHENDTNISQKQLHFSIEVLVHFRNQQNIIIELQIYHDVIFKKTKSIQL